MWSKSLAKHKVIKYATPVISMCQMHFNDVLYFKWSSLFQVVGAGCKHQKLILAFLPLKLTKDGYRSLSFSSL